MGEKLVLALVAHDVIGEVLGRLIFPNCSPLSGLTYFPSFFIEQIIPHNSNYKEKKK